jgi:hypothetical protein
VTIIDNTDKCHLAKNKIKFRNAQVMALLEKENGEDICPSTKTLSAVHLNYAR